LADENDPDSALASSLVNDVLFQYALFLGISAALPPDGFDQPMDCPI